MVEFETGLDRTGEAFKSQASEMLGLLEHVRALEDKIGVRSERERARFEARGQILPHERVERLLDRGAPSIEITPLAGLGMHDDDGQEEVLGGGVIARIGFVSGVRCVVLANNAAIRGGATLPMGLRKYLRAQEIALENRLPVIMLVEAAGANLEYQSEMFVEGGRRFYNIAKLSAAGIPQIAVVHGSSTAGGAYIPGMSDYVIMVRGRAKVFLAGPPLLKAATGEISDDETLGGAEMHATVTGTAEFLAENDFDALNIARTVVAGLGWNRNALPSAKRTWAEPQFDIDDLVGIVPPDYCRRYDIREVIARLVDGSRFTEFKPLFGAQIVAAMGNVEGTACGFLANDGPIYPDAAAKATQFIQLCSQAGKPIVYLQNTTGFMVGPEAEHAGIVKHGAKMIQAVSNATVPCITFLIGGAFGAGYFGMCGRGYQPRFLFAWPNSRISVMGAEQAATVMEIIAQDKARRRGMVPDAAGLAQARQRITSRIDAQSTALYATARMWDDGIIDPRDTRRVLSFCLATCREARSRTLQPTTFGVARI
jgi:geranyl-CoA carboxylase beta subunit